MNLCLIFIIFNVENDCYYFIFFLKINKEIYWFETILTNHSTKSWFESFSKLVDFKFINKTFFIRCFGEDVSEYNFNGSKEH